MKNLLLFVLALCPFGLFAQHHTAEEIIHAANAQISGTGQGWFDCANIWKSSTRADTIGYSGRIYFFREPSGPDSIGQFILRHEQGYVRAYDGRNYYRVLPDKKQINVVPLGTAQSIKDLVMRDRDWRLIFFQMLGNKEKPPFRPERFVHATVDTIERSGQTLIRVTRREMEINENKLSPSDPDTVRSTYCYEFTLPDRTLKSVSSLIIFTESPQYNENVFSPIHPFDDSITFRHVLNFDSLLAAGYITNQKIGKAPALPMVAAGDTLPVLSLVHPDGRPAPLDSLPGKLVLLDFWYKACAPCLRSIPVISGIYKRFEPEGLVVYGVNVREKDPGDLKAFAQENGLHYPIVLDLNSQLAKKLHINAYPSFVLVEPQSRRVLYVAKGFGQDLEAELTEQVGKFLE